MKLNETTLADAMNYMTKNMTDNANVDFDFKGHMKAYQKRMVKEYQELKERTDELGFMLIKESRGGLDFELTCPVDLLRAQYNAMNAYLNILEVRAEIEKIDLE